jgi:hypothetical protein
MNNEDIQKKCNELLAQLGVPGFIVFGFQKTEDQKFGVVYATKDVPANVVIKGMSWALHDYAQKKT